MEYIVYVKPNENSYITAVNSSAFLTDTTDWVDVDQGSGDRFHHAQSNYFDKPIVEDGVYRYKLVSGKTAECTPEEIAAQLPAVEPEQDKSLEERVAIMESDVADLTAAIKKGLSL